MSDHFCVSFRFLAPWFHGRSDDGVAEWPPSPLRAFQALVAAAGRLGSLPTATSALEWLEQLPPPSVIAPRAVQTSGHRLSVPNNSLDVVARSWSRGGDANAAEQRSMKTVRPMRLPDDADNVVHYVWAVDDGSLADAKHHAATLVSLARAVVALGWGVDLVVGTGAIISGSERDLLGGRTAEGVPQEWRPNAQGGTRLRCPQKGTLTDLERRHRAFLARTSLEGTEFRPPPAISNFISVGYSRVGTAQPAATARFLLMSPTTDQFTAFDTPGKGMVVAGQFRHATTLAATRAGWGDDVVRALVLGHGEARGAAHAPVDGNRFVFMPVPSVEGRGEGKWRIGPIRRAMVTTLNSNSPELDWLQRALSGQELLDEGTEQPSAVVTSAPPDDPTFRRYLAPSASWTTVTPVVLPGHDDPGGLRKRLKATRNAAEQSALRAKLDHRLDVLLRTALKHAGFSEELTACAEISARVTGFVAGAELASRYAVPAHLAKVPRFHVRIDWRDADGQPVEVPGPICIGRGRFSGLGLLVGGLLNTHD